MYCAVYLQVQGKIWREAWLLASHDAGFCLLYLSIRWVSVLSYLHCPMTEHIMIQRHTHSLLSAIQRCKVQCDEAVPVQFRRTDMHPVCGEVPMNALAAERLYREWFPNRFRPYRRVFISLDRRMLENVSLQRRHESPGNMRTIRTPEFEQEELGHVETDPITSTRVAREMGAAQCSVWKVLHEQQLHHITHKEPMRWLLQECPDWPDYLWFVLFTARLHFIVMVFRTAGIAVCGMGQNLALY